MAFQDYNPHLGLLHSKWVGIKHFEALFQDPKFYNMLKNTLIISGLSLLTFPAPIFLALIMNEVRNAKFKKLVQTSVYLPHFLSWAIVASLTFFLLSTEQGLVNKIANLLGYKYGLFIQYQMDLSGYCNPVTLEKHRLGIHRISGSDFRN